MIQPTIWVGLLYLEKNHTTVLTRVIELSQNEIVCMDMYLVFLVGFENNFKPLII